MSFPAGFLWGAATSAHQIEGGNVNSDWWRMEHAQPSVMTESSGDACDSFNRYEEDISLLAAAGLGVYRFSIEWARIEPAPGEFSAVAIQHYQRMIDACRDRGVEPVVTLHHFTNPVWLRSEGGWTTDGVVDSFRRYVEHVVPALDGLGIVCTINEPNLVATFAGLLSGESMGVPSPDPRVNERLAACHRHAVDAVRAVGGRAGLCLAMTAYEVEDSDAARALLAPHRALDEDFHLEVSKDADFMGVQVYTKRYVTSEEILPMGQTPTGPAARQTMMGWTFAPESLGMCLRRAHELAPDLPLYVTENGIATENDDDRIAYADGALRGVQEAITDGVDVRGYFHWSLLDNYEWVHGYRPTFGLISVDRTTFARTPKPSLDWLGRVAKANALP